MIQRINAAARLHGLTYSQFMHGLKVQALNLIVRFCGYGSTMQMAFKTLAETAKKLRRP